MKKILTASLVAIMAVTAANADIASTQYVNKKLTGDAENGTLSFTGAAASQTTLQGAVNAIANSLTENLGEGGNVETQIGTAIGKLVSAQDGTGTVVKSVSQTDGKVSVTVGTIANADVAENAAIAQSKIENLTKDLGDKQDKANMIGLVGENYTIPEGRGNEVYLTSDATAKMIDNKIGIFTDNTFADTVDNVEDLKADLGTVTSAYMGTDASNVADAIKEVISEKADKADTLAGYDITDAYTKTETDSAITNKVNTLDAEAEVVGTNDGSYVTAVAQTDGKIKVSTVAFDTDLNADSTNAVQNKVVNTAIEGIKTNLGGLSGKNIANVPTSCAEGGSGTCSLVMKNGVATWEVVEY